MGAPALTVGPRVATVDLAQCVICQVPFIFIRSFLGHFLVLIFCGKICLCATAIQITFCNSDVICNN